MNRLVLLLAFLPACVFAVPAVPVVIQGLGCPSGFPPVGAADICGDNTVPFLMSGAMLSCDPPNEFSFRQGVEPYCAIAGGDDDAQWSQTSVSNSAGLLPELSAEGGAEIGLAVAGLWMIGWLFAQFRRAINKR